MASRIGREAKQERSGQREVAGRDDADLLRLRKSID